MLFRQIIVVSLLLCHTAAHPGERAAEYKIKTAYLYNFAKFVKWPEHRFVSPDSDINVCLMQENPFGSFIDILSGKKAQGRSFNLIMAPEPAELTRCHMIFFPRTFSGDYATVLKRIKRLPILTIGEGGEFADDGGIIAFVVQRGTVNFVLNLKNASTANLTISAKLAEVAKQVIKNDLP